MTLLPKMPLLTKGLGTVALAVALLPGGHAWAQAQLPPNGLPANGITGSGQSAPRANQPEEPGRATGASQPSMQGNRY